LRPFPTLAAGVPLQCVPNTIVRGANPSQTGRQNATLGRTTRPGSPRPPVSSSCSPPGARIAKALEAKRQHGDDGFQTLARGVRLSARTMRARSRADSSRSSLGVAWARVASGAQGGAGRSSSVGGWDARRVRTPPTAGGMSTRTPTSRLAYAAAFSAGDPPQLPRLQARSGRSHPFPSYRDTLGTGYWRAAPSVHVFSVGILRVQFLCHLLELLNSVADEKHENIGGAMVLQ